MDYKTVNDYEILYMIKEKDDYAQDVMFSKYKPIIMNIAAKYINSVKKRGADYEDLIQEGYIGLNNAINSYRESCDSLFYSYACLCIERQMIVFCRNLSSKKHEVLSNSCFDENTYFCQVSTDIYSNPEEFNFNQLEKDKFLRYKNYFDLDYSCIFELRYNGFKYNEISKLLDLSISTIDGRLSKIRKTLQRLEKNYS